MDEQERKRPELPPSYRKAQIKALEEDAREREAEAPKRRRVDRPNPFGRRAGGPP